MPAAIDGVKPNQFSRTLGWAGFILGFGLGGFFDGILLHQVLQWHHLLIAVESPPFQDIRVQILADGLFHVLMYLITLGGLWMLWKARREYAQAQADRVLIGNAFLGFGVWNVFDIAFFHWLLGIHRVRMNVENMLFWDLLWLAVFGIVFIAIGWWIRQGKSTGGTGSRGTAAALTLALMAITAAPIAALPPADVSTVIVFFKPGTTPNEVFRAIASVDGRILWAAGSGDVWALDVQDAGRTGELYRHGAYLVSNSLLGIGCLAWSTART